jgi:hypothetical protein
MKRLLAFQPVVPRKTKDEFRFALSDLTDHDAGRAVLRAPPLLLATSDDVEAAPFCIDVDTIESSPKDGKTVALSEVPNSSVRAKISAKLISTVLFHGFGLRVHWFGSGCKGLHGFCFVGLSKEHRKAIASIVLPTGPKTVRNTLEKGMRFYEHPAVAAVVKTSLKSLSTLDHSSDPVFERLLSNATVKDATYLDQLIALTAYYDVLVPTIAARLRVPCSWNTKDDGTTYASYPLPPFTHDWPGSLVRLANVPLSTEELSILSSIQPPSLTEKARAHDLCDAVCAVRKRNRSTNAIPVRLRLGPVDLRLPPEGSDARKALLPAKILPFLTTNAVKALEDGVRRGGVPPAWWKPEPNTERRHGFAARGGGLGNDPTLPLALLALTGLDLPSEGRAAVAVSLFTSHYPVDAFAEAMRANAHRMRQFGHWASFFLTCAKGKNRAESVAFMYDCGMFEPAGLQCDNVRRHCARAAAILDPHCCSIDRSGRLLVRQSVSNTAERAFTGRVAELRLDRSMAELLATIEPQLQRRAVNSDEANELCNRARSSLRHVYDAADEHGVVRFNEYIEPGGRYGHVVATGFAGIKSVLSEVRRALFRGHWRVDVKRCHTTMLLGCYLRAVDIDDGTHRDELLDRLCADLDGVEEEIRKDQATLRPAAVARLEACVKGSKAEEYAKKFVDYLDSKPKTLLSALLNHADDSPMFRNKWKLASELCMAFGCAAKHARSHPLVLVDPLRPQVRGILPGGPGEKSRLACLLERRAVETLQQTLSNMGAVPSVSVNDEILFTCDWDESTTDLLESNLAAAVGSRLGFGVKVCVGKIA